MPNIIEGIQTGTRQATRDLNRTINRTAGQISDAISNAAKNPNSLGFGQINRTARDIRRGLDRAKDAPVNANFDINPFDDGKVGIEFSGGGLSVGARAGLFPTGNSSIVGVEARAALKGVGEATISSGVNPQRGKLNPLPGAQIRDAAGNLVVDANLIPIDGIVQIGQNIRDILEADANKATNKAYEDYNNRNRKPGQSTRTNQQSTNLKPSPQSTSLKPSPQSTNPRPSQQTTRPNQQTTRPKEISDEEWIRRGETFKPAEPGGKFSSKKSTAAQSGSRGQTAFTIPSNIPNTNARLPKKPQIGGSGVQQNTRLGNRTQNQGGRIVRPEDLEDISANNPNNKPRINQPPQKTEPPRAYRLLTPREKQLFDCVQNGGGDACNKKYGEVPNSNRGSNEDISLSLGDPYIGLGEF